MEKKLPISGNYYFCSQTTPEGIWCIPSVQSGKWEGQFVRKYNGEVTSHTFNGLAFGVNRNEKKLTQQEALNFLGWTEKKVKQPKIITKKYEVTITIKEIVE